LSQRQLRAFGWIGLEREAQHRALLCLGVEERRRICGIVIEHGETPC